MLKIIKDQIKNILNLPSRWICKYEFERQSFTRFNERCIEYSFVFKHLSQIYPRKVLDVGTGTSALPHLVHNCNILVTAIDNVKDYWPLGMNNRHYYIINDDITNSLIDEKFDLITCISVLEHIEKSDIAIRNMFNLLNVYGYLIITFPYNENNYVKNVYKLAGSSYNQNAPYICQSFSRNEINKWVQDNNGKIIDQEFWQFWDGEYWTVGKQTIPPLKVNATDKHQISCVVIQKRK